MKLKAVIKGDKIYFKEHILLNKPEVEVELEVPEEAINIEEKGKGLLVLEAIWGAIGEFPENKIDWEKEWHKHLEEKYEKNTVRY